MADDMTSPTLRALYYAALSLPMRLNGLAYRRWRQTNAPIDVHLGCGQQRYVPGWVNVDANIVSAKIDLWANFADPLPFRDNSVRTFYSFHVIEHLPDRHLPAHFAEMFRALRPGGGIRVGGPDAFNSARKLIEGDAAWFSDYPNKRRSIGGRFANYMFCGGEHLTALSESYLRELAEDAGFVDIRRCLPCRESALVGREILDIEYESDFDTPHSVVIEARKPARHE